MLLFNFIKENVKIVFCKHVIIFAILKSREEKQRRKKQKSDEWQVADGKENEGEINNYEGISVVLCTSKILNILEANSDQGVYLHVLYSVVHNSRALIHAKMYIRIYIS